MRVLDRSVAGVARLLIGADRVQVGCIGRIRHPRAATLRFLGELRQDEVCALGSLEGQDRVECVAPLGGFQRVEIGSNVHLAFFLSSYQVVVIALKVSSPRASGFS